MNGYGAQWRKNLYRSGVTEGELALRKDIPTIAELERNYGEGAMKKWIVKQLEIINMFTGVGNVMSDAQITETANIIGARYWKWNIGEIALFIAKFCNGEYGELYGSVDPLRITSSIRKYSEQRAVSIESELREAAQRKFEQEKKLNRERARTPEALAAKEQCLKHIDEIYKKKK